MTDRAHARDQGIACSDDDALRLICACIDPALGVLVSTLALAGCALLRALRPSYHVSLALAAAFFLSARLRMDMLCP